MPSPVGEGAPSWSSIRSSIAVSIASAIFRPSGPKNLMPLSGAGLCEAEIMAPAFAPSRTVSNATPAVGAGRQQPSGQRRLQHVTGGARVAADQDARALPVGAEHLPRDAPQPEGEPGAQVAVRQPTHAVGSELRVLTHGSLLPFLRSS